MSGCHRRQLLFAGWCPGRASTAAMAGDAAPLPSSILALRNRKPESRTPHRGTDGALGHVVKTATRHRSILAELPSQGVVCRQGACRAAIGISGSDGDGRPAKAVVVLDGLYGVRPARVKHRHGPDIVARRVLGLREAWRQREGCHSHNCYIYLVLVHNHGCL